MIKGCMIIIIVLIVEVGPFFPLEMGKSIHLLIQVIARVDIVLAVGNAAQYHEEEEQWLDHIITSTKIKIIIVAVTHGRWRSCRCWSSWSSNGHTITGEIIWMRGGGAAAAASTVARVFQNETHGNYERLLF